MIYFVKQKFIHIVLGGVHERTIKHIVAFPIKARARKKYSGCPKKSLFTTITTEDKTVTATDKIYNKAADFLSTAERDSGKAMATKITMSLAGFDELFIDSDTH